VSKLFKVDHTIWRLRTLDETTVTRDETYCTGTVIELLVFLIQDKSFKGFLKENKQNW
jgi:hypothetical protein